jgi:hypothetical protein
MPGAVLLRKLTLFFAPLAAHRKGQRLESSFRNLASAGKAGAVLACLEPEERFADPGQGLSSHLKQRKLDVTLDVGIRCVDVIADVVALIDSPFTDPISHVILQLTPAFDQYLF